MVRSTRIRCPLRSPCCCCGGTAPLPASHGPRGGLSSAALRRVLDYLHTHYAERLQLETLAALAGLRVSHFAAQFRVSTGLPPYEYVLRLRVARACELLGDGRIGIAQAAAAAGFYDQSHLARHVRRLLGTTPRDLVGTSRHVLLDRLLPASDRPCRY